MSEKKSMLRTPSMPVQIGAYTVSNIGTAFSWGFITSYFMMFCTDAVGISAAACSTLLLVSRLVDGFTDSACGFITDRTVTRWGRYRPWILIMAPLVAVCTCMLFYSNPEWSGTVKLVWMYFTYFLYLLIFTVFSVPLDSLPSVMSGDPKTRANIISWKSAAGILGALIMTKFATDYFAVHGTSDIKSYFNLTVIFGCVSVPLLVVAPLFCKEKILPKSDKQKKFSLRDSLLENLKYKPFRIALMGHFLNGLITYGRVSIFTYYFKYVAGNMALMATFTLLMRVPQVFGCWVAQYYLKWFKSPGKALALVYCSYGALLVVNFFITPANNLMLFWVFTVVTSFLFGMSYSLIYIIVPDLVDYGEYTTGIRNDAAISGTLDFSNKVGMAIGTSGMGYVLAALNFTPNMAQTPAVMTGINSIMFIAPGVCCILIGIMFLGYNLSRTVLHADQ